MNQAPSAPSSRSWDADGPTLAETGETGLLQRILELVPPDQRLMLGPGDDAAVWHPSSGSDVVLTQDATVEGVDFVRRWSAPRMVGRRALVVALSDLAAMGASPVWCQSTLCAPRGTRLGDVLELQRGLVEAALEFGCAVVGGDLSAIDGPVVIDVSAGGEVASGRALRRDRGLPGHILLVTGLLGGAAAGLRSLQADQRSGTLASFRRRHLEPVPRLAEGRALVAAGVTCAGDVSDGLLVDAARTAAACGCGAELWLDAVPGELDLAESFPDEWPALVLGGGEDFELLVAAPEASVDALLGEWPATLAPLHAVGRLVAEPGVRLLASSGGPELAKPPILSRHFG